MDDVFESVKQRFVEKWLPKVTEIFEQAVKKDNTLEAHFNGTSAEGCARELLEGLSEDLVCIKHDIDMMNVERVGVNVVFDKTGAEVDIEFKMPEPRTVH